MAIPRRDFLHLVAGAADAATLANWRYMLETLARPGRKLLGPESCGWHYVEGLHKDDDPRLAIFWDKEGLDHNGGRLANGGHIVWYLNFDHPHISASEWSKFLAEQEGLHKERLKKQTKSGS